MKDLCKQSPQKQKERIMGLIDQQHCVYDYLQAVWMPLLDQVADFTGPLKLAESSNDQVMMAEYLTHLNAKGLDDADPFLL